MQADILKIPIGGGDHSFNVPRSAPITPDDIYGMLVDGTTKFLVGALNA